MRRTILLLSAAAVVGTLIIAATGINIASGQTDIHVVTVAAEGRGQGCDCNDDGFDFGDRGVKREPLFAPDGTTRVGTAVWDGVNMGGKRNNRPYNRAVFTLEGGQIMIEGVLPEGASEAAFAVVGGTGSTRTLRAMGSGRTPRRRTSSSSISSLLSECGAGRDAGGGGATRAVALGSDSNGHGPLGGARSPVRRRGGRYDGRCSSGCCGKQNASSHIPLLAPRPD